MVIGRCVCLGLLRSACVRRPCSADHSARAFLELLNTDGIMADRGIKAVTYGTDTHSQALRL